MTRQLALPFAHEPAYVPDEFLRDASNEAAMAWLEAAWPTLRLAIWGGPGCGKTHLLHVWAEGCGGTILPGAALTELPNLPDGDGIAVDDADAAPERALLHLLNSAAEDNCCVLLAARSAPARWMTRLPDLASRLRATPAVEISPPGDALLSELFGSLLAERQLFVPYAVQNWMLVRLPREPAVLREAAARLDDAAMAAGRRVTQALAADVVGALCS